MPWLQCAFKVKKTYRHYVTSMFKSNLTLCWHHILTSMCLECFGVNVHLMSWHRCAFEVKNPIDTMSHQCSKVMWHYADIIFWLTGNTYMKFFLSLFISKAHNMRWKKLILVFDENASFSFYGPAKFFRFGK